MGIPFTYLYSLGRSKGDLLPGIDDDHIELVHKFLNRLNALVRFPSHCQVLLIGRLHIGVNVCPSVLGFQAALLKGEKTHIESTLDEGVGKVYLPKWRRKSVRRQVHHKPGLSGSPGTGNRYGQFVSLLITKELANFTR